MKNNKQPEIRFPGFTEDWKQRKFFDNIQNTVDFRGRTPKKLGMDWSESGYLALSALNVKNGYIDPSADAHYGNEKLYKKWMGSKELRKGQVLFTTEAPMGNVAQVPDNRGYILSQRTIAFNVNSEKMSDDFLAVLLRSPNVFNDLSALSSGGTAKGVSQRSLSGLRVTVPTNLYEQKRIGSLFNSLDDTIALRQQELTTLKETKQGFLQTMFPKEGEKVPEIRFSGFTDVWEQRKLGEIMQVTSVKRIHQSDWTDIGVRFLRARDVVSAFKGEEPADYLYISKDKYNEYSKISGKVQQGDMLVTGVGSIGVPYLIKDDSPVYFKDGNIIWFKNDHKINGNFLYYSFIINKIQQYIRNVAGRGTVGTYTIDSGKKTPIQLPTIEEQQIIGSFFKQLDDTIALHQRELDLLKETKKAFLQKMFV